MCVGSLRPKRSEWHANRDLSTHISSHVGTWRSKIYQNRNQSFGGVRGVESSAILVDFWPSGPPRWGDMWREMPVGTSFDALRSQASNAYRIIMIRPAKMYLPAHFLDKVKNQSFGEGQRCRNFCDYGINNFLKFVFLDAPESEPNLLRMWHTHQKMRLGLYFQKSISFMRFDTKWRYYAQKQKWVQTFATLFSTLFDPRLWVFYHPLSFRKFDIKRNFWDSCMFNSKSEAKFQFKALSFWKVVRLENKQRGRSNTTLL